MENLLEKSDYFELDKVERINSLNTESEEVKENYSYSRPLSDDEIKIKNAQINQAIQEIERLKEEGKELTARKSEQTKLILENNKEVISKFVQKTGKVWKVINTSTGFIETINEEGYIIEKSKIKSGSMVNMFKANKKEAM